MHDPQQTGSLIEQPIQEYEDYQYGAPDPDQGYSDEQLRYLLNSDDIIIEVEKYLRGVEYDPENNKWVRMRKPLMNQRGINAIMSMLKPRCSRTITLGILDKREIRQIAQEFSDDLNIFLNVNYKDYALDKSYIPIVFGTIQDMVYATLTRSEDGAEKTFLGRTWKGGERHSAGGYEAHNPGVLGRIKRMIGR